MIIWQTVKRARSTAIEAYADAFAKAVGETCTEDMKEQQREVAKSFTIETINKKIEGFEQAAGKSFTSGRIITPPGSQQGGNGSDPENVDLTGV